MTIGELKKLLEGWPDNDEITFSGGLEFHRFKRRGTELVNMEFNQIVHKTQEAEWVVEDDMQL